MAEEQDLYAVLGVPPDATMREIQAVYRDLIARAEAHRVPAVERMKIEEAFETLSDPVRRMRYDRLRPGTQSQTRTSGMAPRRFPLPAFLEGRQLPQVDPFLAVAIALIVGVIVVVLLVPLFRRANQPETPLALFTSTPTPVRTAAAVQTNTPTASQTAFPLTNGTSTPGASPTGIAGLTGPPSFPFVTRTALLDAAGGVVAAAAPILAAARTSPAGAPSAANLPRPPAGVSAAVPPGAVGPAGVPITNPPPGSAPILTPPPELSLTPPAQPAPGAAAIVGSLTRAPTRVPGPPNRIGIPRALPTVSASRTGGTNTIGPGSVAPGAGTGAAAGTGNRFVLPTVTPSR